MVESLGNMPVAALDGDRPKPWEANCSSARGAALRRELGCLAEMGEAGIPAGEAGGRLEQLELGIAGLLDVEVEDRVSRR